MTPERRRQSLIALLLFVGLGLMLVTEARRGRIPEGTSLPDVTLRLLDGGSLRLSEARGAPLVLDFWASWCGPCRRGLPHVDALARRLGAGARVVAVNADSEPVEVQRGVQQALRLSMPVAVDGAPLAGLLHIETLPTTLVVDAEGRVVETFIGAAPSSDLARAVDALR